MQLNNLAEELLSLIISHLEGPPDKHKPKGNVTHDLRNARLVCRQWDSVATAHLFRTITLVPTEENFKSWDEKLNSEKVRSIARHVVIASTPDPEDPYGSCDYDIWELWETGDYPEYTDAISRIKDLPLLKEVSLLFSEHCRGSEHDAWSWNYDFEQTSTRFHTLKAVFEAIKQRASIPESSKVVSLQIDNLQNVPHKDFTSSELFQSVMKDITELKLRVAEESNQHGPDHDIYCVERVEFEPYLHRAWLLPMADTLTSLTLYFRECWGVMPGFFKGEGLVFPHLQTLGLGYYTIAHHDQLDWVLAQTSLRSLYLDKCSIASHLRVREEDMSKWAVQMYDWEKFPQGAFGFDSDGDLSYHFPGTWEMAFDRMRTSLPHLVDFRFHIHRFALPGFEDPDVLSASLSHLRYITFDIGLLPSQWIQAKEHDGEMEFGNNSPKVVDSGMGLNPYHTVAHLNRSKDTEVGDGRALEALVKATHERRR